LEDGVLDKVDRVDDVGVPCYLGEVDEEAEELEEDADADGLDEGVSSGRVRGVGYGWRGVLVWLRGL
jgi:hypothetical protein